MSLNGFRLAGDSIHLLAILILLAKLWITRSAAGISGKSQILFTFVFISRYLDLFEYFLSYYNEIMKVIFIVATVSTVYSIFIKFRSTYDRTNDAFRFEILVLLAALFAMFINYDVTLLEISWAFSIYLESIAIVPQLYLIYKTRKWETIIKYYLLALGSYRIFYMMNWIWRYNLEGRYDIISITAASFEVFIMVTAVFAIPSDSETENGWNLYSLICGWFEESAEDEESGNNLANHVLTPESLTGYKLVYDSEDTKKPLEDNPCAETGDCGLAPPKPNQQITV